MNRFMQGLLYAFVRAEVAKCKRVLEVSGAKAD
jgi:hypothetical protein